MSLAVELAAVFTQVAQAQAQAAQVQVKLEPVWIERIGFAAATCTTIAFVPQLMRVLKLKSAREVSLPTFLLFSIGVFLWLIYGLYAGSKPVIASNTVTLVISLSILALKLKYDRNAAKELDL